MIGAGGDAAHVIDDRSGVGEDFLHALAQFAHRRSAHPFDRLIHGPIETVIGETTAPGGFYNIRTEILGRPKSRYQRCFTHFLCHLGSNSFAGLCQRVASITNEKTSRKSDWCSVMKAPAGSNSQCSMRDRRIDLINASRLLQCKRNAGGGGNTKVLGHLVGARIKPAAGRAPIHFAPCRGWLRHGRLSRA